MKTTRTTRWPAATLVLIALAAVLAAFGHPGAAVADDAAATVEMYRFYNQYTGEHFYTGNQTERDALLTAGWTAEGIGWVAPTKSNTPVYRLYNPYVPGGDHHYTMDVNEYNKLAGLGWQQEGVGWYSDDAKTVPLYRQYNPYAQTGTHNYTTSKAENDSLVKKGWHEEGTAWYAVATGKPAESESSNGAGNNTGAGSDTNAQLSIVYVTKSGKKFHRQTCPSVDNSSLREISRIEALDSGYTACKICRP